ncbi:MAG: response regulator [bacterium]|nr:response regulator [bacterium]
MKILVVDDQQPILDLLKDVLEEKRFEVLSARDGNAALELYRRHRPPFTLTDISMPGMTGLELLRQIKACNPEAVVMLMTGAGNESYAVEALRGGAVNYFNKPIDINELVNTLDRYSPLATGYDFENYAGDFLLSEVLQLSIDNNLTQVNHSVQMIISHCRAIFPLSEIYTLRFGLYEMMVNAIEHGNLGITYEEKTKALETNKLSELLQQRSLDPACRNRRVKVTCTISTEGLTCTIRDEGRGFDYTSYTSAPDPAYLFEEMGASLHGRGIMLTRLQFDRVEFNQAGNEVTLSKTVKNGGATA